MLSLTRPKVQPLNFTSITKLEKKQGYLSNFTSPLLQLTPSHAFTLEQSFEGVQVFGGTGSGKTSGSGKALARSLLHAGYGGLVLCAKPDEAENWLAHAKATGRMGNVLHFSESNPLRFNFIQYELANGASPFDIAELIDNIRRAGSTAESMGGGDNQQFWQDAGRDLLTAAMLVLYASTGGCVLDDLAQLIATAPRSIKEGEDDEWQRRSAFFSHYMAAVSHDGKYVSLANLDKAAVGYFMGQFAPMSEKMRSSIVQTLMTSLNRFNYGFLNELFTKNTNVVPEMTHDGAIIIVDLPALRGADQRIAAQIWKYCFQRATTRQASETTRPVFLWADESQYFINEKDVEFQSTARSSRVTTVYMTQSLPAYKHAIGGTEKANTATRAFIANLRTQIFHANNDPETNLYAADLIGKSIVWRKNISENESASKGKSRSWSQAVAESLSKGSSWGDSHTQGDSLSRSSGDNYSRNYTGLGFFADTRNQGTNRNNSASVNESTSSSTGGNSSNTYGTTSTDGTGESSTYGQTRGHGAQEQKDYRLDPDHFNHHLRTGGASNGFMVDAIIVTPALPEPFTQISYDQRAD